MKKAMTHIAKALGINLWQPIEKLTKLAAKETGEDREVLVNIGGKKYFIVSDDDYLEHIKNGFEPDMVRLLRAVAGNSEVILDIGANIGCTALLFGELSHKCLRF